MADKETHSERGCFVCGKPALVQYDKNGKLFIMCDGRHPANAGCGARIYLGPGNSARLKSEAAKGKPNGTQAANGNGPATGTGSPDQAPARPFGGYGLGEW